MQTERLFHETMILGECPVWDERTNTLFWIDITAGQLWQHSFVLNRSNHCEFGQNIGMCCLTESEGLVIALEKSILLVNDGFQEVLVDGIEREQPRNRMNDGKCDSQGRLLVGTMHKDVKPNEAALYCLDGQSRFQRVLGNVTISNGLGWSPDNRFLYYVDTPSGILWQFDYDIETGALFNRTPLIDYSHEEGQFDGICVDAQGCIWACHWGGFQVSRWDPRSRRKLSSIRLPVPNVTSCCLGGEKMNKLIITTGTGRDQEVKMRYPLSGALFVCELDVPGFPANRFKR